MKIKQPGKIVLPWQGEWSCMNCKCRWEMEPNDPPPHQGSQSSNDQREANIWYMYCPSCGVQVSRQGRA